MALNPVALACRSCRFYTPEGRRGGNCQQLGVPVRSGWSACSLALPPFAPSWESLEEIFNWQNEVSIVREVVPLHESPIEELAPNYVPSAETSKIETIPV